MKKVTKTVTNLDHLYRILAKCQHAGVRVCWTQTSLGTYEVVIAG